MSEESARLELQRTRAEQERGRLAHEAEKVLARSLLGRTIIAVDLSEQTVAWSDVPSHFAVRLLLDDGRNIEIQAQGYESPAISIEMLDALAASQGED